jgi:hypothetical protein
MARVNYLGLLPFCPESITDGSIVGPGTSYPLALDKYGITYLYWKIKTFHVSYSASMKRNLDNPDNIINCTGSFNGNLKTNTETILTGYQPGFNPKVETDLICAPANGNPLVQADSGVVAFANANTGPYGPNVNFSLEYGAYLYNGMYYPWFYVVTGVKGDDGNYYANGGPSNGYVTAVTAKIDLGDYGSGFFNIQTSDVYVSASGNLVITAGDLWPYNP